LGNKRRKRRPGSLWATVRYRFGALLRLVLGLVFFFRRAARREHGTTSKHGLHKRLSRKLSGFHVVVDTNVLWGTSGVILTRRLINGSDRGARTSAHILASQWSEISRGAKSKDAQRSTGFTHVRRRVHHLRKHGLIVHFSGIVSKSTPNHADDEIVAVSKHWLAEGRRVAVLTKDKELAQRLRRAGTGIDPSRFVVVSDAWIHQLLN
jgi:hypothetical protein